MLFASIFFIFLICLAKFKQRLPEINVIANIASAITKWVVLYANASFVQPDTKSWETAYLQNFFGHLLPFL